VLDKVNQRMQLRRRVLKEGKALARPPAGTIDVIIKDVSDGGARLETDAGLTLPEKFALVMPALGIMTQCEVRWQKGTVVGVRLTGPPSKIGVRRF
jgi:hypothetical protein